MTLEEFIGYYTLNVQHMGWFLGAGASRSANMPSATDIIWDLKRRHYCLQENQDISDNDLSNIGVKDTVQNYFKSQGAPDIWSENEYSYYFELVLGNDQNLHRQYLEEMLHPDKISLTSGSKILASLMGQNLARTVFTTNFDQVVENAFSYINEKNLHSYNLEGTHAVPEALNNEEYPIYAKMHGDFRYTSLKNLHEQLLENDKKIEESFVNACTRFGMVVCGYSGRDQNVMQAFYRVLDQSNPLPKGVFWTKPINGNLFAEVEKFLEAAKEKGVKAHVVEIETYDSLMSKIWKAIPNKIEAHNNKIRQSISQKPKIDRFHKNGTYPLIRTNLFPITKTPNGANLITIKPNLTNKEFGERLTSSTSSALLTKVGGKEYISWGSESEYQKIFSKEEIQSIDKIGLEPYFDKISTDTHFKSFITRALVYAILKDKPAVLKRKYGDYYAVLSTKHPNFGASKAEQLLKNALKKYDYKKRRLLPASKIVSQLEQGIYYMEAVHLSLEIFDNKLWLSLRPDVWIEPRFKRKDFIDFIRNKKKSRYNSVQNDLIDAWKLILLGGEQTNILSAFDDNVEMNPKFEISSRTAYSKRVTNE